MARISTLVAGVTAGAAIVALGAAPAPATGSPPAASAPDIASEWGDWLAPPCGWERHPKPGGGTYECSFEDDFFGNRLDTNKWLVNETQYSGISNGRNCFVKNNVNQARGLLRLTAQQSRPFHCKTPHGAFISTTTTATVSTRDRFRQTYGRFEFRAKFPGTNAPGVHANLWIYPHDLFYGSWPWSGEVDVAEWFSARHDNVYPSVHYFGADPKARSGYNCVVDTANKQFHRYALEWTPTLMRFFYDGQLCFQHAWTPGGPQLAPQPYDKPFNIVMTQVFGGMWNAITPQTPRTAHLHVDWVRAWK